jgi:hypothetical protein
MSKGKSTATAKRERDALRHEAASVPRYWTQWIKPRGAALLSETLGRCYFVIKNHGPASVKLVAAHGDLMDLPAGAVRATHASG